MTKADLESFRQALLALRQRLTGDVSHLTEEAFDHNGMAGAPIHPAELGSDSYEQGFTLSLIQNEEAVLAAIGEALRRIDEGTYGRCEECKVVIPRPRLFPTRATASVAPAQPSGPDPVPPTPARSRVSRDPSQGS
jgi:DnaK suppressor protein